MADIEITCPQCTTVTTVSEFVDDSNLQCRKCGKPIEKPGDPQTTAAKQNSDAPPPPAPTQSGLRLAKRKREYTPLPEDADGEIVPLIQPPPPEDRSGTLELRPTIKDNKSRINHAAIAAALFVVLGGCMGYLRYGGILRPDMLVLVAEYSWVAFALFHVMIVVKAMTDSMLQGILSLLVPGYALFYIFTVSDDFYLRAILAGVLVGIGQDAAYTINLHALDIANYVHGFIAGGGGDIR
jgi:hypothetical protein